MSARDELEALIKRLEEAREGSSDLDYDVWSVMLGRRPFYSEVCDGVPAYTRSVDTALLLIPTGDDICWSVARPTSVTPWGRVWQRETGRDLGEGFAPTYALALCIAALKARARLAEREDEP